MRVSFRLPMNCCKHSILRLDSAYMFRNGTIIVDIKSVLLISHLDKDLPRGLAVL